MPSPVSIALIIDDNKDIQKLVGEILDADYNIITASNGNADSAVVELDKSFCQRQTYARAFGMNPVDIKLTIDGPAANVPMPMAIDTEKIERVFFNFYIFIRYLNQGFLRRSEIVCIGKLRYWFGNQGQRSMCRCRWPLILKK